MKKIGIITSAVGFIFIGLVLGIRIINPFLAANMSKFWFVIFIVLGVEVIVLNKKYESPKFSKLSIFVIILLIGLRAYFGVTRIAGENFQYLDSGVRNLAQSITDEVNQHEYGIKFNDETVLDALGTEISINSNNGDISILHSKDGKIKLESEIILKNGISRNQYKLDYKKSKEGYKFSFDKKYIKKANLILYLPDKYKVNIKLSNGNIECQSEELKADYDIDLVNGYIKLIGDINKASITSVNSDIDIENKEFEKINIENVNGSVNINTTEKNLDISAKSVTGKCNLNGDQSKSIKKKVGDGSSKLEIDVTNGEVNINSKS